MKPSKAAQIYRILGESLPDEVFQHLSNEEIEKLLLQVEDTKKPNSSQEKKVLTKFTEFLSSKAMPFQSKNPKEFETQQTDSEELMSLLESLLQEEPEKQLLESLQDKTATELRQLVRDENPTTTARVLSFANPKAAALLLSEVPMQTQEDILLSIGAVDFHSAQEIAELERFLRFKTELIRKNLSTGKIKDRKGKKAGEILTQLPYQPTQNLIDRIQRKSPEFAETLSEHYYRMEDLLELGRASLTTFLAEIHPLVTACAWKGIDHSLKESLYSNLEPWLLKEIKLEADSLGPISIAEIEEAQKGLLDRLSEEVEAGTIKLWRVK